MTRRPLLGRLSELAPEDRPREKLLRLGREALTDEELVAILLGTGRPGRPVLETARDLLRDGGLSGLFRRGPRQVRAHCPGIGDAKACRLDAALEIARRLGAGELASRLLVDEPAAAARYLVTVLAGESREVMGALLLDAKGRLLKDHVAFRGTVTGTSVEPGWLFREAVLEGAVGAILYHNHPSGDPTPSPEDRFTTARLVEAGRVVGVEVRDHIVVGRGAWVSFRQQGLL